MSGVKPILVFLLACSALFMMVAINHVSQEQTLIPQDFSESPTSLTTNQRIEGDLLGVPTLRKKKRHKDYDFVQSLDGNYFDLSNDELMRFMNFKEALYEERRDRVTKLCSMFNDVYERTNMHKIRENSISYSKQYKVAYCQIAKVSGSVTK